MSSLANAARFLMSALAEAADAWSDPDLTLSLLLDLGWELDALPPEIAAVGTAVASVETIWRDIAYLDPSDAQVQQVLTAVTALWSALQTLESMPDPPGLDAAHIAEGLATTLLDYFIVAELQRVGGVALPLLELVGIVEIRYIEQALPRQRYMLRKVHWELLPDLLSNPGEGFRARYGWGTSAFDSATVLARIRDVLAGLRWSALLRTAPADEMLAAGDTTTTDALCVDLELLSGLRTGVEVDAGLRFLPIRLASASPGLAIVPYVDGALGETFQLDDHVSVTIDASFDLQGGVVVAWTPELGVQVKLGAGAAAVTGASGQGTFELDVSDPDKLPKTLFDALGVQLVATTAAGLAQLQIGATSSYAIEVELKDGVLSWDPSQAPGVLGSIIGGQKAQTAAQLALGWSTTDGFYFRGGNALGTVFPATLHLGPVTITALRAAFTSVPSGAGLALGTDGKVVLGPITMAWQGLGASLTLAKPDHGALPVTLGVDPAVPTAISISVASTIVDGSGSIQHTDDDHYAGALSLTAHGISISGAAAIAKDNGAYSVAALATATWPGIPLGLGFELVGMTALFGLRRRVDDDAGRAMLRTGGITALLTSSDPLRGLDALSKMLPVTDGRDVVGIGPTIGWGEPRILQADLALLLELPDPIRLVLLASVQLGFPTLSTRIVDIRLDAIGVLDLSRQTLALDASLHDSKLAGYVLTGDMSLRLGWGDEPELLLAIGGFHPKFTPPPNFPTLQRLQLTAGTNPQLRLQAYLALTSNTAQVGAQADLSYKGGGFTIAAQAGFDALFVFSPFQFDVEIDASASISWHGYNLASVSLDFELTGPHPWHAVGNASFSILWWSPSVGFDTKWGDATPAALPPPPDIAGALRQALGDPSAWQSQLPADEPTWLTLASATTAKLHPLGAVVVRERVVPLGMAVTEYGNVPLAAPVQFAIASVTVGGTAAATATVTDAFAPGQFTQLSNDQKLAAPSFEQFQSGVVIGAAATTTGALARASLDEQTIEIDPLGPPPPPPAPPVRTPITWTVAGWLTAARQQVRAPARSGPALGDVGYVLASTSTLAKSGGATTYAGATAARAPGLQVVPIAHAR